MEVVTGNKDLLGSSMVVVDTGTDSMNNVNMGSEDSVELEDNWDKVKSNDDAIELEESWDKEDELADDKDISSDTRKANIVVKVNSQSQVKKKVALDVSGVVSFRRSGENVSDCVLDDTV